jgi:membrane metallo-endopeptidase-like protein 1
VSVGEVEYLCNVSTIIGQTSSRTLQNYIVWRFMLHQVDNMPKRFRVLKKKIDRISRGITAERLRTVICGKYVNDNMGFAVSKLYIKKYFDEHVRIQVIIDTIFFYLNPLF